MPKIRNPDPYPEKRLIKGNQQLQEIIDSIVKKIEATEKDIQECEEKFMGSFEDWLVGQPDNYMFRSLCGNACMEIDRGKLTKQHMDEVKKRLANFDIIMTFSNMLINSNIQVIHV